MESDRSTNYIQKNSGLLRYRSAPSSLLENFAGRVEESVKISGSSFCCDEENCVSGLENGGNSNNRSGVGRIGAVNSQLPPQYPRQSDGGQFGSLAMNSMDMDHSGRAKMGSGLMRLTSYPARLFSHLNSQNGYAATRGIVSYRMNDGGGNEDLTPFSSRYKNNMDLSSSRISSSFGMLSRITEVENENGFSFDSWNGSLSSFTENFATNIKREFDSDHENPYADHTQNGEPESGPHTLSRHLSLPKTSATMATMEKLLQLQDSVPCKIRAKRGCATHPRSIAERIRRTKISERMRKLQDLVPNMDKQTNTADMLDLAVEYIQNLQKQYKTLSENRANCKCLPYEKTGFNQ